MCKDHYCSIYSNTILDNRNSTMFWFAMCLNIICCCLSPFLYISELVYRKKSVLM